MSYQRHRPLRMAPTRQQETAAPAVESLQHWGQSIPSIEDVLDAITDQSRDKFRDCNTSQLDALVNYVEEHELEKEMPKKEWEQAVKLRKGPKKKREDVIGAKAVAADKKWSNEQIQHFFDAINPTDWRAACIARLLRKVDGKGEQHYKEVITRANRQIFDRAFKQKRERGKRPQVEFLPKDMIIIGEEHKEGKDITPVTESELSAHGLEIGIGGLIRVRSVEPDSNETLHQRKRQRTQSTSSPTSTVPDI